MDDNGMDDIRNIALGILLLMVIALAHTICYELDDETSAMENSKSAIFTHPDAV